MRTVRPPKRATAKFGMNFRGANNGLDQATREIMRDRQSDASQRCRSEASSPIRQAYMISAGTFGNGVSTPTKATTMQPDANGECSAEAPGPPAIVWKCNPSTEMYSKAMSGT